MPSQTNHARTLIKRNVDRVVGFTRLTDNKNITSNKAPVGGVTRRTGRNLQTDKKMAINMSRGWKEGCKKGRICPFDGDEIKHEAHRKLEAAHAVIFIAIAVILALRNKRQCRDLELAELAVRNSPPHGKGTTRLEKCSFSYWPLTKGVHWNREF